MSRKQHERLCLDRFLAAIGESPASIEETESPDFVIRFIVSSVE